MREIKFRVYDTVNKCFISDMSNFWINPSFTAMMEWRPEFDGQMTFDLNDSLIFQQYTGLKDKNGVEIYEGDYVLYPHKSGPFIVGLEQPSEEKTNWVQCEVKWKTGGLAAYWGHNDCNIVTFNFKQFIVVGNIFEGVDE